jgi:phage terminase large subunit GpA-like protein
MIAELVDVDFYLIAGFQQGIKPDPVITPREWADTYRILPDSSARPGKFSSDFTPYVREPMDRLSVHDPAQKVIVKKSSQVGFTEVGNNWLGYVIDVAPAGMLYVMPTDTMMKDTSKNRIEKMIESTPAITDKIAAKRSKDSSNTLLFKEFRGGFVKMVGANSPVGLASTAVRYVYMDEIDRYPLSVGGEGSAEGLAETRTITFGARKKILLTSTPTRKGLSAIDIRFESTGQRYYHVPCPFCNEFQILVIDQIVYEPGNYADVKYKCACCDALIDERFKGRMLKQGKWIAKYPEREDGIIYGYFINALYSPSSWFPWSQLVKERDEAENDIPKKIVFTNTKLGLAYETEEKGDKPDWENIYDRAEDYEQGVPFSSVAFITAGVDVQADRLEIEVVGWIKGKTSQSIEYIQLIGDTNQAEVWGDLSKLLMKTWVRQGDNAIVPLRLMALDTGYNTVKAYEFAQKHGTSRVIPVKGMDKLSMYFQAPKAVDILKAGQKVGKVKVWGVGVSIIKTDVYGALGLRVDSDTGVVPDGYCYFPTRDPSYFRGLTAEEIIQVTNKRGYPEFIWHKKYKRNEPLDCRVYARAAAAIAGMDRWDEQRWNRESNMHDIMQDAQQKTSVKKKKKIRGSDFW